MHTANTTVSNLILLLAFVIEIGNNEVSYLLFWQRYSEDNIVSFLLYFPGSYENISTEDFGVENTNYRFYCYA